MSAPPIGFSVPDGDPARLSDAAAWHQAAADEFDRHAGLIDHTAGSLHPVWRGDAASSYQTWSGALAAHFRIVADSSRSASTILQRYARELEGYQQEGRRCSAEAQHWQRQVETERARLATLVEAHAMVGYAERGLHHAEDELRHWQARGRQVWQEAHDAGSQASTALGDLTVPPPPTATASPPGSAADTLPIAAPLPIPAAAAASSLITTGGPSLPAVAGGAVQGALSFGDLEEIGRRFGWSHAELQAWWQVISDESGGNPGAVNASSGAFGIGQFLGATYKEYLPFGAGSPHPLDQLNAMAQYIHDRYGSPLAALAHECACHWY